MIARSILTVADPAMFNLIKEIVKSTSEKTNKTAVMVSSVSTPSSRTLLPAVTQQNKSLSSHECKLFQSYDFWALKRDLQHNISSNIVSKEHIETSVTELFGPRGVIHHVINSVTGSDDSQRTLSPISYTLAPAAETTGSGHNNLVPSFPRSAMSIRVLDKPSVPLSPNLKLVHDYIPTDHAFEAAVEAARNSTEQTAWTRLEKASRTMRLPMLQKRSCQHEAAFLIGKTINIEDGMMAAESADIADTDDDGLLTLLTEDELYDALLSINRGEYHNASRSEQLLCISYDIFAYFYLPEQHIFLMISGPL